MIHNLLKNKQVILASASPRRFELLTTLGVEFRCQPADIDEAVREGESPLCYVQRMAREKSAVVAAQQGNGRLFCAIMCSVNDTEA